MPNCAFTPPVDQAMAWTVDYFGNTPPDADPLAIRLMGYFAQGRRASNVYVMEDGTVTTAQPPNWNPTDPTGPYATVWNYAGSTRGVPFNESFTHPPNLQVRHVYWGGHTNYVYPEDEALLRAAGYDFPDLVCEGAYPYPSSETVPWTDLFPGGPG